MTFVQETSDTQDPVLPLIYGLMLTWHSALIIARPAETLALLGNPEMDTARKTVIDAGYPEYMYGAWHGLRRSAHDGGRVLGPRWEKYGNLPDQALEARQVYTVEPGVAVPGYRYVGFEEDVLVTEKGTEMLSTRKNELVLK